MTNTFFHFSTFCESVIDRSRFFNNFVGVYNVSEETLSLDELAKRLIKEKGNSESKIIYNEKGNTFQFKVDNSKLLSVLQ